MVPKFLITPLTFFILSTGITHAQEMRYERDSMGNRISRTAAITARAMNLDSIHSSVKQVSPIGNHNSSTIAYDWELDATADVGEIPMSTSVLPNGMAVVQIPLITGSADAQGPSLSLTYSSYSGRGDAGYGWSISGLSTISLTNKNRYFHGSSESAVIGAEGSVYVLDGQPLLANDLALQSYYSLRVADGQILVQPHKNAGGKILYFTAAYPDGSTAVFGYERDVLPAKEYPITKRVDRFGEQTTYVYAQSDNEYRLTRVNHAGGFIEFSYIVDSLSATYYRAGQECKHGYLLKTITSGNSLGHQLVQYSLTHEQHDDACLLKKVELSTDDGHHLNPLTFHYYGEEDSLYPNPHLSAAERAQFGYWTTYTGEISYYTGKFISGVYDDGLVYYPSYPSYKPTATRYVSGYPDNMTLPVLKNVYELSTETSLSTGAGFQFFQPRDIDGDGIDELIKINFGAVTSNSTSFNIKVYRYNDAGIIENTQTLSTSIPASKPAVVPISYSPIHCIYEFGDFLDAGYQQLLIVPYKTGPFYNYPSDRDYKFSLVDFKTGTVRSVEAGNIHLNYSSYGSNFYCMDIDSDGKTEIVSIGTAGTRLCEYDLEANAMVLKSVSSSPAALQDGVLRSVTDINNDGYLDFILSPRKDCGSSLWTVNHYNGSMLTSSQQFSLDEYQDGDKVMFKDVNNDGYPDYLRVRGNKVAVRLNDHGEFTDTTLYHITFQNIPEGERIDLVPLATEGFDNQSFGLCVKGHTAYSLEFSWDRALRRKMEYAVGSYGTATRFYYEDIRYYSPHYSITQSFLKEGYRSSAFNLLPVTTMVTAHICGGAADLLAWKDFFYTNAVLNSQGLGFCGFQRVREDSYPDGKSVLTFFAPDKRGVVTSSESFITADRNKRITTNTYNYLEIPTSYGRTRPRLRTQYSRNYLDGTESTLDSIRYNSPFDLPAWTRTRSGYTVAYIAAHKTARTVLKTTTYRNVLSADSYIVGLTQSESTNTTSDMLPGTIVDVCTYHYGTNNLPKVVTRTRGDGTQMPSLLQKDSLYYDAHGNIIRHSVAHYGGSVFNAESFIYDSTHHSRLLSTTDAMGHTTNYSDFDKWGKPRQSTDWRGRISSIQYDVWGNAIGSIAIDGTYSGTITSWGGDGLYTVTSTASGSPLNIIHYNDLGQNTLSEQQRFDGSMLKVRKLYDNQGRTIAESLPFKNDLIEELSYTTYSYDEYSRPISVISPGGRGKTWTYNSAYSVTQTEDRLNRITTVDPFTLLQTSSDGSLTVETTPTLDGQTALMVVYPDCSPERELSRKGYAYDRLGRLVGESDTYTGEKTYSYTNLPSGGVSVSETCPNGSILTSADRYGRTTFVERSGEGAFTSVYSYNEYGLLSGVSNTADGDLLPYNSEQYNYDAFDRPTIIIVNNGFNRYFTREYSYNSEGQIAAIHYSSQNGDLGTESRTYSHGHLYNNSYSSVSGNPESIINIWTLQEENSYGQPVRGTSGALTREYGYDNMMSPASRRIRLSSGTSSSTGPFIQRENYMFRPTDGNLGYKYVQSSTPAINFYNYDSLNRLIQDQFGSYSYNDAGDPSISVRNGEYRYENALRMHQETGVSNAADTVATRNATQTLLYSAYRRPVRLGIEDPQLIGESQTAIFHYNQNLERCSMSYQHNTPEPPFRLPETKYYAGGCYEGYATGARKTYKDVVYLGGTYYSAPAAVVVENGIKSVYFIGRNYQGSITHIIAEDGSVVEQTEYDSWGLPKRTLADGTTLDAYAGDYVPMFFGRGYTGHEHLQWAGLINMNARLYDPFTGRFLSPDPVLQDPLNPQTYNPYNYCLNNPLKYTDESGEIFGIDDAIILGALAIAGVSMAIDYGIQVLSNYIQYKVEGGISTKDIFLTNVDWFDICVSGVVGGVSGGLGVAAKSGKSLGSIGKFLFSHPKLVKSVEVLLTSSIDITGNGWKDVSFNQFTQRFVTSLVTMEVSEQIVNSLSKHSINTVKNEMPEQSHHFATNKNKIYTPQLQEIANKYGLDLNGEWNKAMLKHLGRHPNEYHDFVLQTMYLIDIEAAGDQQKFLQLFDLYIKQVIVENPILLRKNGWKM